MMQRLVHRWVGQEQGPAGCRSRHPTAWIQRFAFSFGLLLVAAGGGCTPEKEPEHLVQRRAQQQQAKQRREEGRRRFEAQQKTDRASEDIFRLWPNPVREAFMLFHTASPRTAFAAAQRLASLGIPAIPALRYAAGKEGLNDKKRAMASLMWVDLLMFQPDELAKLAEDRSFPYVQQGAIEVLGRYGDPLRERLLKDLAQKLVDSPRVQEQLSKRPPAKERWRYSEAQLVALDRVLQADSPEKLQVAMEAVRDRTLEQGLRALLESPAVRPPVRAAVGFKFIELAQGSSKVLRAYCGPQQPKVLRLVAFEHLVSLKRKQDRPFLEGLASNPTDPLAQAMRQILLRSQTTTD